jgi:hypothetical protein
MSLALAGVKTDNRSAISVYRVGEMNDGRSVRLGKVFSLGR